MSFCRQTFKAGELIRIGGFPVDDPPLRIGDRVELNSGSPVALVVAADGDILTISWRDAGGTDEALLPRACLHRVAPQSEE